MVDEDGFGSDALKTGGIGLAGTGSSSGEAVAGRLGAFPISDFGEGSAAEADRTFCTWLVMSSENRTGSFALTTRSACATCTFAVIAIPAARPAPMLNRRSLEANWEPCLINFAPALSRSGAGSERDLTRTLFRLHSLTA